MIHDLYRQVRDMRQELRDWVKDVVYRVARFTYVSVSSADGTTDAVEGHPLTATENGGQKSREGVRRLAGVWGVWSRPPAGEPALVIRAGNGATNGVIVACGGTRYAPAGLNDGEVSIYNKATGCTILLDQNGKITINAAAGQDIALNGGVLKVARVTDQVTGTAGPYPIASGVINGPGATNVKA